MGLTVQSSPYPAIISTVNVPFQKKKKSIYVNDFESRQKGVLPWYPGHKGMMLKTQPKRQRTYRHIANSVSEIQMTKRCTWPFWGMVQWPFAQVKWRPTRETKKNQTLGSLKLTFLSSFSRFSSNLHGLGFSLPKNILKKSSSRHQHPGRWLPCAEQRETPWPRQFRPIGHSNRCLRPGHPLESQNPPTHLHQLLQETTVLSVLPTCLTGSWEQRQD